MTSKNRNQAPIPRIPGLGFVKLARRLSNSSARRSREAEVTPNDEDWYIPYSGPYEAPKAALKGTKKRDSWGDPVYGDDDEEGTAVASLDSPLRYHVDHDTFLRGKQSRDSVLGSERPRTSPRYRSNTHSATTGQTTMYGTTLNSGTRTSFSSQRRSTVHSRPPMPSYINLDAAGGVGESPAPPPVPPYKRSPSKDANTLSIASIFSISSQGRNRGLSGSYAGNLFRKLSRGPSTSLPPDVKNNKSMAHRRSSSESTHMLTPNASPLRRRALGAPGIKESGHHHYDAEESPVEPIATSEDPFSDYNTPSPGAQPSPSPPASNTRHPYAAIFPSTQQFEEPQTAPLPGPMTSQAQPNYKALPRRTEGATRAGSNPRPPQSHITFLSSKSNRRSGYSASTPDLRLVAYAKEKEKENKPKAKTGSKDRWLSPETWCDALLFPRPRLKLKVDGDPEKARVMSTWGFPATSTTPEPKEAVVSRVLQQSRSLHNLRPPPKVPSPQKTTWKEGEAGPSRLQPNVKVDVVTERRASRPKSFSWDDLAIPTPVPSLSKVLEDGERLDSERKGWQQQATHSFQNSRSRSISRARSKSLTQKGSKRQESWAENMDFLAARACLGKQIEMPAITIKVTSPDSPQKSPNTIKRAKHQEHTRTDSWSKSAFKNIKPVGRGIVSGYHQKFPSADSGSTTSLVGGFERALRRGETKVIRQPDPAQVYADHLAPSEDTHHTYGTYPTQPQSVSPTPSGTSAGDVRMGIALSTPPMVDNSVDMDSLQMPAHPYAQGGMYTSSYAPQTTRGQGGESKTPSPIPSDSSPERDTTPTKESPRYHPFAHPYAQRSPSESSYISEAKIVPVPRHDSTVPPPAKMWVPVGPGVVTEVLPGEMSYSPFLPEHEHEEEGPKAMEDANDTVGMGEALAFTSGSQSENVTIMNHPYSVDVTAAPPRRSARQPVQYDTSRPYLNHARTTETGHTLASSDLLRLNSDPATHVLLNQPELPRHESEGSSSSAIIHIRTTSTSPESPSPPLSPRPFDNPDVLDNFHDLFYKSRHQSERQSQATMSSLSTSGAGTRGRRGGSGLTSLARQISEELMELEHERDSRDESQYSTRTSFDRPSFGPSRRPTGSSLEFVFEENPRLGVVPGEETGSMGGPIASTFSSVGVPEDVESSRASSPLGPHAEEDEDDDDMVQMKTVHPFLTPPTVFSPHRTSMTGHMSIPEGNEEVEQDEEENQQIIDYALLDHEGQRDSNHLSPHTRYSSGLRPFSSDIMRSSYITTSTMSRMSGLSDFPEPPTIPTGSMLNNFFEKQSDTRTSSPPPALPTRPQLDDDETVAIKQQHRLTLGGIDEDYASSTASSPASPISPVSPISPTSFTSSRS